MHVNNILLVWDRIGDYHLARYVNLSNLNPTKKIYLASLSANDQLYLWNINTDNYPIILLSDCILPKKCYFKTIKNFIRNLRINKIDFVCLAGYGRMEYIILIIISKILNKRVLIFAESWYQRAMVFDKLKHLFLILFCDYFLVSGLKSYNLFVNRFLITKTQVQIGYSAVDNNHFYNNLNIKSQSDILLCVARYSKEKELDFLIESFIESKLCTYYKLEIIGDGPLKNYLINKYRFDNIIFIPWQDYDKLPIYYSMAKFFILASSFEPWGLVVNEAMSAGLPIIASDACGCVPDLVDESNGFIFAAGNKSELIKTLNCMIDIPDNIFVKMGEHSQEKVNQFSLDNWSEKLMNFIEL